MEGESLQAALAFLDSWLEFRSRQVDIPGFCVAIYWRDSIIFSRAYGFANVARGEPLTTEHVFGIASQSKMFTAVTVLQLLEAGKLQLDDPASRHLPWLLEHRDRRFADISLRQLLSHSAGLVRDGLDSDFWELKRPFPNTAGLRTAILGTDLATEPNKTLKYSNLGYALLGQVIAKLSGQTYQTYVRKHIIEPLGLHNTFPDYAPAVRAKAATGYSVMHEYKRLALEPRQATNAMAPAIGIYATVEDMCRFAASQFSGNDILLNDRLKQEIQRTQAIATSGRDAGMEFGLGFRLQTKRQHRLAGHDGHLLGHLSTTFFDPDQRLAVAVAANTQDAPGIQILNGIFETLDWFASNRPTAAPRELTRFNARLRSNMASIDMIATTNYVAAVDPASWSPFARTEVLKAIDDHTLRIVTPGNFDQAGELVTYTFNKDVIRAVRYSGLSMLPESGYVGRKLTGLESEDEFRLTLEDIEHAILRTGRVIKVESCRGQTRYRLLVDFGPQYTARFCYLPDLPPNMSKQMLIGKQVLGADFAVWSFGTVKHEIVALGLATGQVASTRLISSNLLALTPDPSYPRTVGARIADRLSTLKFNQELRNSIFKFEARSDYPAEDIGSAGESLAAWRKGKYHLARTLFKNHHDPDQLAIPCKLRIIVTDERLSAYQRWSMEYKKCITVPRGDTVYLLPRKYLRGVTLPEGDFTIWDNKQVTVNGYSNTYWTHTNIYDKRQGNDITSFLNLQHQLTKLAHEHGHRLHS